MRTPIVLSLLLLAVAAVDHAADPDPSLPHLRRQGTATQLMVGGKPFLIRGGETGNSAASNPTYLQQFWTRFAELNLNTVLAPLYWELIEPEEGRFDFSGVDQLLAQARGNRMRLVLLWFGSWKNSMSCYAPAWVKRDPRRFPRAADADGTPQEILSPFSTENRDTDARAFAVVQKHLRETDGTSHTVLMIQVENEIGMIPTARDHSALADRAFAAAVPAELMAYLEAHKEELAPELRTLWLGAGAKTAGAWSEVFGSGPSSEEVFMAWHFARYTEAVTAAGKREYPLPMFVNAALIRPGHQPGQYPSAGPLPHLIDVWRAAAPSLDFMAPDIYFQNFTEWARRYACSGNPLFIPEAMRSPEASVNALYAVGAHDAIGFSPFGIESIADPAAKYLAASYALLAQLEPLILALQGKGAMAGLLSEGPEQRQPQQVRLGGYVLAATFERGTPPALADGVIAATGSAATAAPPSGGLVLATGPDEFVIAGTAVTVTFASTTAGKRTGILQAEEGRFVAGRWENLRWLNGDETHQGRHVRLEPGRFSMQRVRLYLY
jgi:beta-galactosidase GanA